MVIYVPPCYKYMAQNAWRHGDIFCGTWAVLACPILWSESSWFAPHDRLVCVKQYRVSRFIRECTWALLRRLLHAPIALVWPCELSKTLVGDTTEWLFRMIRDPF